jgi:hypothetical protein
MLEIVDEEIVHGSVSSVTTVALGDDLCFCAAIMVTCVPLQPCAPSVLQHDGTLLQDMLTAAVHSRGAYGYAMAAGYVSSILAYVRLQTLQKLRSVEQSSS